MKITNEMVLFYTKRDIYSNHYPSVFNIAGINYVHGEQYMMAQKAKMFGDLATYGKILQEHDPLECKHLGRQVKDFNALAWVKNREEIVTVGLIAKTLQNKDIKKALEETGDRVMAEASRNDVIWGIGLYEDDPRALDQAQWQGTNLLGRCWMEARQRIFPKGYGSVSGLKVD